MMNPRNLPAFVFVSAGQRLADLGRRSASGVSPAAGSRGTTQGRCLADWLAGFEGSLPGRGLASEPARRVACRARAVVKACSFTRVSDLSVEAVLDFIASLGNGGMSVEACSLYLEAATQFWHYVQETQE
jgi:hypothetical protein